MFQKLLDILQFNTIRTKIIFAFIFVGLVPFLIFAVFSYQTYSGAFYDKITSYSKEVVNNIVVQIDDYLLDLNELLDMKDDYYINQAIKLIQANEYQKNRKYIFRLWEEFNNIITLKSGLNEFSINFNDGQVLSNYGLYYLNDKNEKLYQNLHFGNKEFFISKPHKNVYDEEIISIIKPFNNEKIKKVFISTHFNINILKSITNLKLGQQGYIFIVNNDGKIIYHPDEKKIGQSSRLLNDKVKDDNEGSTIIKSNDNEYVLTYASSEVAKWKVISVADTTEVTAQLNDLKKLTIIGIITIILALAIIIFYLSYYLTNPIKKLERVTEKAVHKNLNVDIEIEGKDEIAKLGESFNKMMYRIRKLVKENIAEQKQIRELEMKSLYEQIKPHFIYNTLDMIIGQLEDSDNIKRASFLIESLGRFFRLSFAKGKEMVTIKKEIEHIKSYLDIQKLRFLNDFEYIISIEDQVIFNYYIPKLLLQPLVENAIYHGILNKEAEGLIMIKGFLEDEKIIFKVIDNGPGISENKVEKINNILSDNLDSEQIDNYGLYNVNKRIKYKYGEEFGLYLDENKGDKTVFRVEIGIIIEGEENG